MSAPTIPIIMVTIIPPGCRPGTRSFAITPAISPKIIHVKIPICLPPYVGGLSSKIIYLRRPSQLSRPELIRCAAFAPFLLAGRCLVPPKQTSLIRPAFEWVSLLTNAGKYDWPRAGQQKSLEIHVCIIDNASFSNTAHRGVHMPTRPDRLLGAVLAALLVLVCHSSAEPADTVIGRVPAIEGSPKVLHSGKPDEAHLKKHDRVSVEDRIRTLPNSRAYVLLNDKGSFSLAPDSIVFVNDYGAEKGATFFHAHVAKGLARFVKKLPVSKPESSFVLLRQPH